MSNRDSSVHDCIRMLNNMQLMPTHEAVVNLINRRPRALDALSFNYGVGLENYPTEFEEYVEFSDDDDDDDDDEEYGSQRNRYCGFTPNFLDGGFAKPLPAYFKTVKRVSPEEAANNAKQLLDEEEKLKKKAEKKKQKKMRQRERRRQEKLEKENTEQNKSEKVNPSTVKSKPTEECENKNKTSNGAPVQPEPGPQISSVPTDSSDGSDEEADDDEESVTEDLQELDMNSCFVTNAAAIAKRKLEQKPKSDRRHQKVENTRKHGTEKKGVVENHNKKEELEDAVNDFVTKSMELAVMGNTYAQKGNLEMAVTFFTDAIKYNPKEFKLFGNRSFCYEKMQQYEKALIDADIALSLEPNWIKGLYRKGKALVGLKKYYEAGLTYKEVLKLDSSCTDAAQELMRVQIMQLMDMGFTREQSSNALIIHGTVEKALEALSGLQSSIATASEPSEVAVEDNWVCTERKPQPPHVPLMPVAQNQPRGNTAARAHPRELFPIWVGDLTPTISESKIFELFRTIGPVYSVRVLQAKRCAFVNYFNKEDCEKAIRDMHAYNLEGTSLVVRYPDRIHTHLGASKTASVDIVKANKLPNECYYWRTTGCIKNNRCAYRHIPEHKGIDRSKPT